MIYTFLYLDPNEESFKADQIQDHKLEQNCI